MSHTPGPIDLASPDIPGTFAALAAEEGQPGTGREVFPEVEIVTGRLLLRAYAHTDVEDQVAMFDHDIVRRWSNAPQPYTLEHSRAWCTRIAPSIRTSGDGICWAVTDRTTGRLLGCTGLYHTHWRHKVSDVSATGAPWAVGHGYAKEALRAISRWALMDQQFNRLQITAATGNLTPQRVAVACGFVREGILRNAGSSGSRRADLVMYGLVPSDLQGDQAQAVPGYRTRRVR
ncbi:MAG TPA: GNAT family protein [Streptosporangiaceae bacterium]